LVLILKSSRPSYGTRAIETRGSTQIQKYDRLLYRQLIFLGILNADKRPAYANHVRRGTRRRSFPKYRKNAHSL